MSAAQRRMVLDGSTNVRGPKSGSTAVALATATPSTVRVSSRNNEETASAAPIPVARPDISTKARSEEQHAEIPTSRGAAPAGHGWIIQIGATDAADKATDLLNRAKSEGRSALASARPFMEKVKKGDATLYRARFAGLGTDEAAEACKTLKRSGFACFAAKD
jgi:D-alanyl-D-alanine carboxypeptidase